MSGPADPAATDLPAADAAPTAIGRPGGGALSRRWLVAIVTLVALLGVLAVAERAVVARAEARIAQAVGEEVGVAVEATIPGWPAAPGLLSGRIDRLRLEANDVPLEGRPVTLERLVVDVVDLRVQDDVPVAGRATFRATVDEAGMRAAVTPAVEELLLVREDGLALDLGLFEVPLQLTVVDDELAVAPAGAIGAAAALLAAALGSGIAPIPLESPAGVEVTGVDVEDARLVFTGTLDPVVVAES